MPSDSGLPPGHTLGLRDIVKQGDDIMEIMTKADVIIASYIDRCANQVKVIDRLLDGDEKGQIIHTLENQLQAETVRSRRFEKRAKRLEDRLVASGVVVRD